MRTAAGVLLIVMFLVNGVAALGYTLMGGVVGLFGIVADDVGKNAAKHADEHAAAATSASTSEDAENHTEAAKIDKDFADDASKAGKDAKEKGGGIIAFGLAIGAVAIAQLVVAVAVLGQGMPKKRLLVIGAVGIVAEIACALFLSKFGWINGFGCAVGALVIACGATLKPKGNPYALQPAPVPYGAPPPPPYGAPPGYP